jgi:hypothetical protein
VDPNADEGGVKRGANVTPTIIRTTSIPTIAIMHIVMMAEIILQKSYGDDKGCRTREA